MNLIKGNEYLVMLTSSYRDIKLKKIKVLEVTKVAYLISETQKEWSYKTEKEQTTNKETWILKTAFIPNSENLSISNHNGQTIINPIPHNTTITPSEMYVVMEDLDELDTSWVTGDNMETSEESKSTVNETFTPIKTINEELTNETV